MWENYEKMGFHANCICHPSPPAREPSTSSCRASCSYGGHSSCRGGQGSAASGATSSFSHGNICGLWPDGSSCRSTPGEQTQQLRQKFFFKADTQVRFSQKETFLLPKPPISMIFFSGFLNLKFGGFRDWMLFWDSPRGFGKIFSNP